MIGFDGLTTWLGSQLEKSPRHVLSVAIGIYIWHVRNEESDAIRIVSGLFS